MQRTLEQSINLHEQLEGGYHTHHTEESDTHGWAVADGGGVVGSWSSMLERPNESASAEEDAREESVRDNPGQKGVFSAVMVHPFEGGTGHADDAKPMEGEPHDSVRFERKLQELLMASAHQTFPTFYRAKAKVARQR